jgi:DNA-binding NarL/FixJ family response regulator
MPRVFLTCGDATLFETLRKLFLAEGQFEICVEQRNGIEAILEAIDLYPDLIILGMDAPPIDDFEIAEALKLILPDVQVFLATELRGMEVEKEALSRGIDAVFERDDDLKSLAMNARDVCGLGDSQLGLN